MLRLFSRFRPKAALMGSSVRMGAGKAEGLESQRKHVILRTERKQVNIQNTFYSSGIASQKVGEG